MNRARVALGIAVSSTLAWAGLFACSSSNGTSTSGDVAPTPSVTSHDAGAGADSYVPTSDSSAPADAGSDCGTAASLHVPKADGGMFCPFSAPTGGKNIYCSTAQECCENPKGGGVSTCETRGTACPVATATAWECESPVDCAAGQVCCAHSGTAGTPVTIGTDVCGPYLSKFSGTKCAATCATGELVVCEQASDCTSGTCTAVKPKGNDIGVCQ